MLQRGRLAMLAHELRRKNPTLYMEKWADCACGFAGAMPEFQLLGFSSNGGGVYYISDGRAYAHDEAVERFFGLTAEQNAQLFYSGWPSYARSTETGAQVADRIDAFIEANAPQAAQANAVLHTQPHKITTDESFRDAIGDVLKA